MSSEKTKINKNDLANGKANGEQNCDETSEVKKKHTTIEDPKAKTEAKDTAQPAQEADQPDHDGEEVVAKEQEQDERVLPEIDDPNNDR